MENIEIYSLTLICYSDTPPTPTLCRIFSGLRPLAIVSGFPHKEFVINSMINYLKRNSISVHRDVKFSSNGSRKYKSRLMAIVFCSQCIVQHCTIIWKVERKTIFPFFHSWFVHCHPLPSPSPPLPSPALLSPPFPPLPLPSPPLLSSPLLSSPLLSSPLLSLFQFRRLRKVKTCLHINA